MKLAISSNPLDKKIGKLRVVKPVAQTDSQGNCLWECLCDCGNKAVYSFRQLSLKQKISCGCSPRKKAEQGERFGSLTVVITVFRPESNTYPLLCVCDCGSQVLADKEALEIGEASCPNCADFDPTVLSNLLSKL